MVLSPSRIKTSSSRLALSVIVQYLALFNSGSLWELTVPNGRFANSFFKAQTGVFYLFNARVEANYA